MKREDQYLLKKVKLVAFDFDGVFTNNKVIVDEFGHESVICNRSDGIGLRKLDTLNIEYLIISTEKNPVVTKRAEKLGIRCIQGTTDKVFALKSVISTLGINFGEVAFVGNDINDAAVLNAVGVPIIVRDADKSIKRIAKFVLTKKGGEGAVREICDKIAKVRGLKNSR